MTTGGDELRPGRAPLWSVVVPAHNEEDWLPGALTSMLDGLRARDEPFEVVVCENGSSDRTAEVAKEIAAGAPEVRIVELPVADYGQALRAGFLAASGELVVNFDVDLIDLTFLDRAADVARRDGVAIVVGSKRSPGSDDGRPVGRRAVTGIFSGLLRYGFGLRVSDTHGLKLLRREALLELVEASRCGADIFDTELVLRAERAGLGVGEIPVRVTDQRPPRTPIAARIPRTLLGLARLRLLLWQEDRTR